MSEFVYIARADSLILQNRLSEAGIPFAAIDGAYDEEIMRLATALVPGKLPVTEALLNDAPALRVISKYGVGLDRIDIDAATRRGILVCNTPTVNYISVAEHCMTLMLMAAKKVRMHILKLDQSPAQWRKPTGPKGAELSGKTLAVIGLGRIGRTVAKLAHAFDMEIVGYDPYANPEGLPEYIHLESELCTALSMGDFVTIHVAGNASTKGMIGEKELAAMKNTAILVNTTRGSVIDEAALIRALDEETIAGAALDVLAEEPVNPRSALLYRENVIITPHCAANTEDAHRRAEEETADNLFKVFAGHCPDSAVNAPGKGGGTP